MVEMALKKSLIKILVECHVVTLQSALWFQDLEPQRALLWGWSVNRWVFPRE